MSSGLSLGDRYITPEYLAPLPTSVIIWREAPSTDYFVRQSICKFICPIRHLFKLLSAYQYTASVTKLRTYRRSEGTDRL